MGKDKENNALHLRDLENVPPFYNEKRLAQSSNMVLGADFNRPNF